MLVNLASRLLTSRAEAGSLLYCHPEFLNRWWWREFGRVSYVGGRDYLQPTRLTVEFQEPTFAADRDDRGRLVQDGTRTRSYPSLLFRHPRERETEYFNRRKRAHYHNFVRSTCNMLVSHATKRAVTREGDPLLDEFWRGVDYRRQKSIDAFTRDGLRWAQVMGITWACVDNDPRNPRMPYAYWVSPLDILDWEVDGYGELIWLKQFVSVEAPRSWNQPVRPLYQFRIWTRDSVTTWQTDENGGSQRSLGTVNHGVGKVPFVPLFSIRDEQVSFPDGQPLLIDLCKGSNHVFNLSSLLSDILYRQTFSWLAIPDPNVDTIQIGLGTAFGWNPGLNGGEPKYISPDADQARVLMEAADREIERMRQAVGVGRGRSDGSREQASADAIELESEDKRSILADIATEAEDFERRLAEMARAYRTASPSQSTRIEYAREFNVRALQQDIDECLSIRKLFVAPEVDVEMFSDIVRRKFTGKTPAELDQLVKAVEAAVSKRGEERPDGGVGDDGDGVDDSEEGRMRSLARRAMQEGDDADEGE